jgi:hypothetical protein
MVKGMSKYYGLVSRATVATQGQGMKLYTIAILVLTPLLLYRFVIHDGGGGG